MHTLSPEGPCQFKSTNFFIYSVVPVIPQPHSHDSISEKCLKDLNHNQPIK